MDEEIKLRQQQGLFWGVFSPGSGGGKSVLGQSSAR